MLSIGSAFAIQYWGVQFGAVSFWDKHGILFLVLIALFPRLTLLFSSLPFGGLFWWLGWFFAPRLLVSILATVNYWETNKVLVIVAWLIAMGGESSEKYVISSNVSKDSRRNQR
jgi:hypothetical protein